MTKNIILTSLTIKLIKKNQSIRTGFGGSFHPNSKKIFFTLTKLRKNRLNSTELEVPEKDIKQRTASKSRDKMHRLKEKVKSVFNYKSSKNNSDAGLEDNLLEHASEGKNQPHKQKRNPDALVHIS